MNNIISGYYSLQLRNFNLNTNFNIANNGITAIIGPSGCGKTTFLRCLAGLTIPDQGNLLLQGTCLQDSTKGIFIEPQARNIGFVFQDTYLFPHLNVNANLKYGYKRTKDNRFDIQNVIEMLNLKQLLNSNPRTLSGGEKQRVAIARALLMNPTLLLLDEPVNALDYKTKKLVFNYIKEINSSLLLPILLITHELNEIKHLLSQYLPMSSGTFSTIRE